MRPLRLPGVLLAALMLVTAAGCDRASAPPPQVTPVACEFPYRAPVGWKPGPSQNIPAGGLVASQQVFRDGKRVIAYSAGVLRDQFETAPIRQGLPLSGGGEAMLFEIAAPQPGYTLFWYGPEPCKQFAIDGVSGFSDPGYFLEAMREIGVLAAVPPPSP